MTRHLLRLIWNRKRQNLLLMFEIFAAFLVVFGVTLLGAQAYNNSRYALGFDVTDVWLIQVDRKAPDQSEATKEAARGTMRQVFAALADFPQIVAASGSFTAPYANYTWGSSLELADGRKFDHGVNRADDRFGEAVRLNVTAGRWFTREDDGAVWAPVVLNQRLARAIFGDANPVGQVIREQPRTDRPARPDEPPPQEKRVVGVIEDFRQHGELSAPQHFLFVRQTLDAPVADLELPTMIVVRLAPGTTAAFEETLTRRLETVARDWSFGIQTMEAMRDERLESYLTPLYAIGTVAGFLMLMVALGLTGVVWQSVTQRTQEFGLRRANGATAGDVARQVLGEMMILATVAVLAAILLIVQLPALPLPRDLRLIPGGVFAASIALSCAAIYLVTVLAGLYPSRLSSRVAPAEALHYE